MNQFLKTIVVLLFLAGFCLAQTHQDWSYNLGMYEVNMRQYTEEGTFDAFSAHLDRLQEMGVGMLWFMPIHPIGEENRLGSLGSNYSVKDYLDVNPNYGTLDYFKTLVQAVHDRGMIVILDWVANHTSCNNVLTTAHPPTRRSARGVGRCLGLSSGIYVIRLNAGDSQRMRRMVVLR